MTWTDERIDLLKKLWADGRSASQIAKQLGVTRNAVIGKVNRLDLPMRKTTVSTPRRRQSYVRLNQQHGASPDQLRAQRIKDRQRAALKAIEPDPVPAEAQKPLRLSLINLTDKTCKWPIGDPQAPEFHFCGNTAPLEDPYCPFHQKMAYQPNSSRDAMRRAAQHRQLEAAE